MVGYAVARLRVALWKRVAEKVRLIAAVNAIRTNAGFDTLGDADAAKREFARVSSASVRVSRTTSRTSFAARNRETSDCADPPRLARAFSAPGIGGSPVSTAAIRATMTRRGPDAGHPMGESHRRFIRTRRRLWRSSTPRRGVGRRLATRRGSAADAEEDPEAKRRRGSTMTSRRFERDGDVRGGGGGGAVGVGGWTPRTRMATRRGRTSGGGGRGRPAPTTRGKRLDGGGRVETAEGMPCAREGAWE